MALVCALGAGCSASTLPPLGEVLIYADTDLPVPELASRLRIDVYSSSGVWLATRDVPATTKDRWPISFAVNLGPNEGARDAVVRLRAYKDNETRRYEGERFVDRFPPVYAPPGTVRPAPLGNDQPRLLNATRQDVTPTLEPEPMLAVDRVVQVRLVPGVIAHAGVTLHGGCAGTMADLRDFSALTTCVDTEGVLVDVHNEPLSQRAGSATPSLAGTFGRDHATPCAGSPRASTTASNGTPLHDEEVCVVGGAFMFGMDGIQVGGAANDTPKRIALVSSFYMDRYEVTVARFRAATAKGFLDVDVVRNEGPLSPSEFLKAFTWSRTPLGREEFPLNGMSTNAASDFCAFAGQAVPTEVEWEYAATMAGRQSKTSYPWGEDYPRCADVVFGRAGFPLGDPLCLSTKPTLPAGIAPVTAFDQTGQDVALGTGLVGLGGSMRERTADSFASLGSNCWLSAPMNAVTCQSAGLLYKAMRGTSWIDTFPVVSTRESVDPNLFYAGEGLRCVRHF